MTLSTLTLSRFGIAKIVGAEARTVLDASAPGLSDTTKAAIAEAIGRRVAFVMRGKAEIVEGGVTR
jgi:hypothetical protein